MRHTLIIFALLLGTAFAKDVNRTDFTLMAHVVSYEHEAFVSRVEAEIGGTIYVLNATNLVLGHRCNASKMDAKISIQAGTDYPARVIKVYGRNWFQFVIAEAKHPLCDLEVTGTKQAK